MATDDEIADLSRRVGALEEKVELEANLRASMDVDLGDAKAFQRAVLAQFNAIGQTLSEHGRMLHGIGRILDRIDTRLAGHHAVLARHDEALARHDGMLREILAAVRPDPQPDP